MPREQKVEREQHSGPEAVTQAPEEDRSRAHRQRLVDGRRMNRHVGGDGALGVGHRPGPVPGLAVVAVAGKLAADAADRVADRQRNRAQIEKPEAEHPTPPRPSDNADRAADRAAVPGQPGAREYAAEEIVPSRVEVVEDVVEPGPDEAAGKRGEGDLIGPIGGLLPLHQAPCDHGPGDDEAETEAEPEGLQRQRSDVDLWVHAKGAGALPPRSAGLVIPSDPEHPPGIRKRR